MIDLAQLAGRRCVLLFPMLLLAVGFLVCVQARAQTASQPAEDDRGSVRWMAHQAKHNGQTSITLPDSIYEYAEYRSLDDALRRTSVTLATMVGSAVVPEPFGIVTWRKYRRMESLSTVPVYDPKEPIRDAPRSLLPLAKDEFLVPSSGGTLNIDGVEVTEHSSGLQQLPIDHPHLMFLVFRGAGGTMGVSNYGPIGFLWVDDAQNIHPVGKPELNPIYAEIIQRTGGDVSRLRARVAELNTTGTSPSPIQ